jgi:mercuric ion transport protein
MKLLFLEKTGAIATVSTAMTCPACWPLIAGIGSALGLGILLPLESIMMNFVFPIVVVVAIVGSIVSFRFHRKLTPLLIGLASGGLILFGFYVGWQLTLMYIGIFGLLISSALGHLANHKQAKLCQT